jgi:2,3-bisphosphoglycerate-independent phosphoglycerate mutase
VTMTEYDRDLPVHVAYPRADARHTLAEVVSDHGATQYHVAETEKYAHVTYFINGGREDPFTGEDRLLVPSPRVATYELAPEMSAMAVTDAVVSRLESAKDGVIIVNFANPDMVGHTGDFAATVTACEVVDGCIDRIVGAAAEAGGGALITADHGNAELKVDAANGEPLTAHTTSPVPVILCGRGEVRLRSDGGLADVAPTVLTAIGMQVPAEMTGTDLVES